MLTNAGLSHTWLLFSLQSLIYCWGFYSVVMTIIMTLKYFELYMLGIVFILGKYVVLNNLLPKIVFANIKKTWVKSFLRYIKPINQIFTDIL
jgi:hypothetical protein